MQLFFTAFLSVNILEFAENNGLKNGCMHMSASAIWQDYFLENIWVCNPQLSGSF